MPLSLLPFERTPTDPRTVVGAPILYPGVGSTPMPPRFEHRLPNLGNTALLSFAPYLVLCLLWVYSKCHILVWCAAIFVQIPPHPAIPPHHGVPPRIFLPKNTKTQVTSETRCTKSLFLSTLRCVGRSAVSNPVRCALLAWSTCIGGRRKVRSCGVTPHVGVTDAVWLRMFALPLARKCLVDIRQMSPNFRS